MTSPDLDLVNEMALRKATSVVPNVLSDDIERLQKVLFILVELCEPVNP